MFKGEGSEGQRWLLVCRRALWIEKRRSWPDEGEEDMVSAREEEGWVLDDG